jgi:hypothetical protein
VTSGGVTVADINFIGTYTSATFQLTSGPGGTVKITDPAAGLQPGNERALKPDAGDFANSALFSQYMAVPFGLGPVGEHTPVTEPAVSGSTALLAHGH